MRRRGGACTGEVGGGAEAARGMPQPTLLGQTAAAFAQLGQGKLSEARETYQSLNKFDGGDSRTVSGLGDLAIYEGRFSDAERILAEGAAADLKNEAPDRAAAKLVALAHARMLRGRTREAIGAIDEALKASQNEARAAGRPASQWAALVLLGNGDLRPFMGASSAPVRSQLPVTISFALTLLVAGVVLAFRHRVRATPVSRRS